MRRQTGAGYASVNTADAGALAGRPLTTLCTATTRTAASCGWWGAGGACMLRAPRIRMTPRRRVGTHSECQRPVRHTGPCRRCRCRPHRGRRPPLACCPTRSGWRRQGTCQGGAQRQGDGDGPPNMCGGPHILHAVGAGGRSRTDEGKLVVHATYLHTTCYFFAAILQPAFCTLSDKPTRTRCAAACVRQGAHPAWRKQTAAPELRCDAYTFNTPSA